MWVKPSDFLGQSRNKGRNIFVGGRNELTSSQRSFGSGCIPLKNSEESIKSRPSKTSTISRKSSKKAETGPKVRKTPFRPTHELFLSSNGPHPSEMDSLE
jgi:hypothetical protein